ncbi:hypothetical protein GALMADRAFT_74918 [Galerina marginata CBS 339.88]|uniref:Uncharacterized protein n=1 Tax=Galerina marginata (strain CBS 339.88) TaxID=685588 RepID=A0A067SKX3_GALM3|nr:hypothetical protein GALMADRAFT_74918 [Galerina marginata CBS 339.88]
MVYTKESDPPAYDTLVGNSRSRSQPTTPTASTSSFQLPPKPPVSATSSSRSWIPWSAAQRTSNEVQANVRNLIRQLVVGMDPSQDRQPQGSTIADAAGGILHSCADACAKHEVSLSTILQDKYIEGHSPLYWAIAMQSPTRPDRQPRRVPSEKHDEAEAEAGPPDVLGVFLSYTVPMKSSAISELRLACLSVSDQKVFQRLRILVPKFSSLSGASRVLLGPTLPSDDVSVEIASGHNDGAFAVNMQFSQFHKRLMVSREVGAEFVVRNRIWRFSLTFIDYDWPDGPGAGTWCARLSLQYSSPSTWFDGRLVLFDPQAQEQPTTTTNESGQLVGQLTCISTDPPNPENVVRMRCKSYRLEPSWGDCYKQICVSLEENPAFASLQYAETSYIPADAKLTVRLEARLTRPPRETHDECRIA